MQSLQGKKLDSSIYVSHKHGKQPLGSKMQKPSPTLAYFADSIERMQMSKLSY